MSQQIQCPHCGQAYALTAEQVPQYAGQTITCTRCQKSFTVARDLGSAPTPPPMVPQPMHAQPMHARSTGPTSPGMPNPPTSPYPPHPGAPVQYAQGGYGTQKSTSGLAIASLVLAIIGLLFAPLGIVAIILGIVALTKMKDPRVGGKGLAIAGISVGAVDLIMVLCLISILLPSLGRARETANRVYCASNMRQIGQAMLLYANENQGAYPPTADLLLTTQDITAEIFCCPSSNDEPLQSATAQQQAAALNTPGHLSYVYVGAKLNNQASADTVVAYEPMTNHANDGSNFLWGDGHVSWESKAVAQKIIADVQAGKNPPTAPPGGF